MVRRNSQQTMINSSYYMANNGLSLNLAVVGSKGCGKSGNNSYYSL